MRPRSHATSGQGSQFPPQDCFDCGKKFVGNEGKFQVKDTGEFDKAQEPEVDRAAIDFRDMALRHAGPDTDVALAQPYGFPCRAQTLGDMFSRVCHLIFFPISEFNLDMFYLIIPLFRDSRHITGTETVQMPPRRRPPRSRASGPV